MDNFNLPSGSGVTDIYFLKNREMIRLGSYSSKLLYNHLDDTQAVNILTGLIKNENLFWESDNTKQHLQVTLAVDDNTIYPGKEKCNTLREIRKKIAEVNDIKYEPAECHHKGPCMGTCPVCDSEIKYLDDALQRKKANGEVIRLNGIARI